MLFLKNIIFTFCGFYFLQRLLVIDTIRRGPTQGSPFLDRGTTVRLLTARINRQYVRWTFPIRKQT